MDWGECKRIMEFGECKHIMERWNLNIYNGMGRM